MAIRSRGVRACRLGEAFDIQRAAVVSGPGTPVSQPM
jgi:hypothetical protein